MGGRGIGAFGALGDSGTLLGREFRRGDMGGEFTIGALSFAARGFGAPRGRSNGRGLIGRPGLRGGELKVPSIAPGLSRAFREPTPAAWETTCFWHADWLFCVGVVAFDRMSGDEAGDLSFFDLLRASSALCAAMTLSRSSSSRVLRRPRSCNEISEDSVSSSYSDSETLTLPGLRTGGAA